MACSSCCKGNLWRVLIAAVVGLGVIYWAQEWSGGDGGPVRTLTIGSNITVKTTAEEHISFAGVLIDSETQSRTPVFMGALSPHKSKLSVSESIPEGSSLSLLFAVIDGADAPAGSFVSSPNDAELASPTAFAPDATSVAQFTYREGKVELSLHVEDGKLNIVVEESTPPKSKD